MANKGKKGKKAKGAKKHPKRSAAKKPAHKKTKKAKGAAKTLTKKQKAAAKAKRTRNKNKKEKEAKKLAAARKRKRTLCKKSPKKKGCGPVNAKRKAKASKKRGKKKGKKRGYASAHEGKPAKKKAKKSRAKKKGAKRPTCISPEVKKARKRAKKTKEANKAERQLTALRNKLKREQDKFSERYAKISQREKRLRDEAEAAEKRRHGKKHGKKHKKPGFRMMNPITGHGEHLAAAGGVLVAIFAVVGLDRALSTHALQAGNTNQPAANGVYNAEGPSTPVWSSWLRASVAGGNIAIPFGLSVLAKSHPKTRSLLQVWGFTALGLVGAKLFVDVTAKALGSKPTFARLMAPEVDARNSLAASVFNNTTGVYASNGGAPPPYALTPGGTGAPPIGGGNATGAPQLGTPGLGGGSGCACGGTCGKPNCTSKKDGKDGKRPPKAPPASPPGGVPATIQGAPRQPASQMVNGTAPPQPDPRVASIGGSGDDEDDDIYDPNDDPDNDTLPDASDDFGGMGDIVAALSEADDE